MHPLSRHNLPFSGVYYLLHHCAHNSPAFANACKTSLIRSSPSSPTFSLTNPSPIPNSSLSFSGTLPYVILAGCSAKLSTPPKLSTNVKSRAEVDENYNQDKVQQCTQDHHYHLGLPHMNYPFHSLNFDGLSSTESPSLLNLNQALSVKIAGCVLGVPQSAPTSARNVLQMFKC